MRVTLELEVFAPSRGQFGCLGHVLTIPSLSSMSTLTTGSDALIQNLVTASEWEACSVAKLFFILMTRKCKT